MAVVVVVVEEAEKKINIWWTSGMCHWRIG